MPDDVTLVEALHRDLRTVRWAEPAEIRATARRRSRRTAALAAVSVVVVAALAATMVDRAGGPPPPAADTLPGYAEIPVAAMLAPGDVPVPTGERLADSSLDEPARVDDLLQLCGKAQGLPAEEPRSRYSRSQTMLAAVVAGKSQTTPEVVITQDLYRIEPDAARRFIGDLEHRVRACGAWQAAGQAYTDRERTDARVEHRWTIAESGFAGDQAVLLRHTATVLPDATTGQPPGYPPVFESRVVVRVGDLVSVLVPAGALRTDLPDAQVREAQMREVARAAAARMCVAANPGC
ncbi:hypothetical protein [Micromonospora sp. AKA38]|uniref:hypothetical protein n=1 Tax=Micromonospora sp. AKA38 TaxID=2733861 RepID=UPI0022C4624C|nr:hypothetical protein [Micromonospora sp. AKA38]GHJ17547.1 hypothetical protein TPA0908_55420 [Micromonospora sp. AKA38]